jgi:hypothetical protein
MHVKQWLMIGTLTGGALLVAGSFSPAAQAASGGGGAQINGTTIWTTVSYSQSGGGSGWHQGSGLNWTPPSCWLEPWPGGFGVSPGDTPGDFADFMGVLDQYAETQGSPGNPDGGADQWEALYQTGTGDDPIVHMVAPPYDEGQNGLWYGIACSTDSTYADLANFIASLHLNNSYEDWFFVADGKPPAGVTTIDPNILAEYAASKVTLPPDFPKGSPPFTSTQTVELPTLLTSAADYKKYTVTASLAALGMSSTVTATPYKITISSTSSVLNPKSVTCTFSGDTLPSSCALNFTEATTSKQSWTLTGSMIWKVVWPGADGEAGWTKYLTVPLNNTQTKVQEIQTVVN